MHRLALNSGEIKHEPFDTGTVDLTRRSALQACVTDIVQSCSPGLSVVRETVKVVTVQILNDFVSFCKVKIMLKLCL